MTETYGAPTLADDITDDETATARLDREASDILARAEGRTFASTTSVRRAVREDLHEGRLWARAKADATREAIVEQPLKTALYAIGAGVLIGLLLRR